MKKKLIPLFVLLILVLSSLACGGGGDIVTTSGNVVKDANTVENVLDSNILEDMNRSLIDTLQDIDTLSCETGVSAESMCK